MTDYIHIAQLKIAEDYPLIIYARPPLRQLPPGAIIGTWAYSVPGKMRFILARHLELAAGVLPADVSRTWIRDQYKLPLRRRNAQMTKPYTLPLHAVRGKHGDCSYIDIRGAYLNILSFGYDVEYRRSVYIGADPRPVPAQIAKHKFCYAITVAMSASKRGNIQVRTKTGTFTNHPFNMFANPCLYNLACDTLNGIAAESLSVLGNTVKYINTDGYIVENAVVPALLDIIRSWGFDAKCKAQGETEVFGVGAWKVGDEETARRDGNARDFTSVMMDRDERRWLKTRMWGWSAHLPKPETIEHDYRKE